MPQTTLSLAKTTQPTLSMVLDRERLFKKLDADDPCRAVWITGPPGSGKTTLIASYLQARQLTALWYQLDTADADVATFFFYLRQTAIKHSKSSDLKIPEVNEGTGVWKQLVHRIFRAIFARFNTPLTIVFDNLEAIPLHSELHSTLVAAIEEVPQGSRLVFVSRSAPGPAMARYRANKIMTLIDGDDLKLNDDENKSIARIRDPGIKPDTIEKVQELTAGWMTGSILMYEYSKQSNHLEPSTLGKSGDILFDYVAQEVFNTFDEEVRNFLLSVCWPRRLSVRLADTISNQSVARQLLANLARNNYFITERYDAENIEYIIHPLLRDFLQARVTKTFRQSAIVAIKQSTAEALIGEGQIEEAVTLLVDIFDWDRLEPVIRNHAALLIEQGRSTLLVSWLEELPDDRLKFNPWLLYWYGKARFEQAPREARQYYEMALHRFKDDADNSAGGRLAAGIGIIEAVIMEADDYSLLDIWVPNLEQLIDTSAAPGVSHDTSHASIVILIALMLRNPAHEGIDLWFDRAEREYREIRDDKNNYIYGFWLVLCYLLAGQLDDAESLLDVLLTKTDKDGYLAHQCRCLLLCTMHQILSGRCNAAGLSADKCLEIAESQNLYRLLPLVFACRTIIALINNELQTANLWLDKLTNTTRGGQRLLKLINCYLSSWYKLNKDESINSLHDQRQALYYAVELGMPFFEVLSRTAYAQLLFLCEDNRSGTAQLRRVHSIARDVHNPLLEFMTLLVYGDVAMREGKITSGSNALRYALGLARKHAYYHLLWWRPKNLADVCATALQHDIETDFVRDLIKRTNLRPGVAPLEIPGWPWPFEIRVLGGFSITADDHDISSVGKSQARPVQLLKILIALGGKDIRFQQIAETLWPHVDDEYGIKSLTINLHRLRRLLGNDEAILLQEGMLSVNDKLVWLDIWALDQLYSKIERSNFITGNLPTNEDLTGQFERLLDYYRGPFLGFDDQITCLVTAREYFRSRFVKAVEILVNNTAGGNSHDTVCEIYEAAIQQDPCAEELYCNLMVKLIARGDQKQALKIYERCLDVMARTPQYTPSQQIQKLYARLQEDPNNTGIRH